MIFTAARRRQPDAVTEAVFMTNMTVSTHCNCTVVHWRKMRKLQTSCESWHHWAAGVKCVLAGIPRYLNTLLLFSPRSEPGYTLRRQEGNARKHFLQWRDVVRSGHFSDKCWCGAEAACLAGTAGSVLTSISTNFVAGQTHQSNMTHKTRQEEELWLPRELSSATRVVNRLE